MACRRQLLAFTAVSLLLLFPSPVHRSPPPPSSFLTASTDAWAAVPHGAVDVDIPGSSRRLGPRHRILSDVPSYAEADDDPAPSSSEADTPSSSSASTADSGVPVLLAASPVHATPPSPVVVSRRIALGPCQLPRRVLLSSDVPAGAPAPAPNHRKRNWFLDVLLLILALILACVLCVICFAVGVALGYAICWLVERGGPVVASFVADNYAAARAWCRKASERVHPVTPQDAGGAAGPIAILFVLFAIAILVAAYVKVAAYVTNRCATAWLSIAAARKKATRVLPLDEDAVVRRRRSCGSVRDDEDFAGIKATSTYTGL
ncbi:hypothetical protein EJB05_51588, partial [Eragrostis curvula]